MVVEIEFGADRGIHLAVADRALQQLHDLAAKAVLERHPIGFGIARRERVGTRSRWRGQQVAGAVDQSDSLRLEPRHSRGDELPDSRDLALVERLGPAQRQHDRGRGRDFGPAEQRALRRHDVHARGTYASQRADGARELTLHGAAQVDVRKKVAGGEGARTVEELVAHRAADRHSLLGQRHSQAQGLAAGDHHGIATGAQSERHVHGLEAADDLLRIVERQAGEQQRIAVVRRAADHIGEEAEHGAGYGPEREDTGRTQGAQ